MMDAPDPFNSWEELAEAIQSLTARLDTLEDQMGSVRRTMYGIPKGDAGDREFTKSVPEFLRVVDELGEGRRTE